MTATAPTSRPRRTVAAARLDAASPTMPDRGAGRLTPSAIGGGSAGLRRSLGGRLSAGRIACWQAVLVVGVTGAGRAWWLTIVAGAVLAAVAIPVRGTWLSTLAVRALLLFLRRLRAARPGPAIGTARIGGADVGVIVRPQALAVVVRAGHIGLAGLLGAACADGHGDRGGGEHWGDADGPRCELQVVQARRPRPRTWLVVRALRDADCADDEVLLLALGNVLRRLRRRGLDLTPATAPDLAAGAGREEWRGWRAGPVLHIALRLVAPGAVSLQRLLVAAGDADLSVAVRADGDRVAGVLRVTADATVHRLLAVAPGLGLHLERLDGRHGPAIAATLPLGEDLP